MEAKMLTLEEVNKIKTKKICIMEYSKAYLREMYDKFPELPYPYKLYELSDRYWGKQVFDDHEFNVYSFDELDNLEENSVIIINSGYYMEDVDNLEKRKLPSDLQVYYFANKDTEIYMSYNEKFKNQELKDILVFRSGPAARSYVHGMDYADNARALFEHMLANGYNTKYKLVWMVKNPDDFKDIKDSYDNVDFYSLEWAVSGTKEQQDLYYDALCNAKFLFFTDAYGFCRYPRKGQVRVQLWHGCGFKTRVRFVPCEKRYEYTTVIGKLYADIHEDIFGLRKDQVLITGYAKEDWLFHPVADWKERLNIPKGGKYIFWLPTFRTAVGSLAALDEYTKESQTGLPVIDKLEDFERINDYLAENNAVMVIKLHPFQDRTTICNLDLSNIVLLDNEQIFDAGLQINQILGAGDALISDYSSAAVDYLILDRPMGFTLDDVEEYKQNRGFHFDPVSEWMPGAEIYDSNDFEKFIQSVVEDNDFTKEKRSMIKEKMHDFNDDKSCERIIKQLGI